MKKMYVGLVRLELTSLGTTGLHADMALSRIHIIRGMKEKSKTHC